MICESRFNLATEENRDTVHLNSAVVLFYLLSYVYSFYLHQVQIVRLYVFATVPEYSGASAALGRLLRPRSEHGVLRTLPATAAATGEHVPQLFSLRQYRVRLHSKSKIVKAFLVATA